MSFQFILCERICRETGWTAIAGTSGRVTGWTAIAGTSGRVTGWTAIAGTSGWVTGWTAIAGTSGRVNHLTGWTAIAGTSGWVTGWTAIAGTSGPSDWVNCYAGTSGRVTGWTAMLGITLINLLSNNLLFDGRLWIDVGGYLLWNCRHCSRVTYNLLQRYCEGRGGWSMCVRYLGLQ